MEKIATTTALPQTDFVRAMLGYFANMFGPLSYEFATEIMCNLTTVFSYASADACASVDNDSMHFSKFIPKIKNIGKLSRELRALVNRPFKSLMRQTQNCIECIASDVPLTVFNHMIRDITDVFMRIQHELANNDSVNNDSVNNDSVNNDSVNNDSATVKVRPISFIFGKSAQCDNNFKNGQIKMILQNITKCAIPIVSLMLQTRFHIVRTGAPERVSESTLSNLAILFSNIVLLHATRASETRMIVPHICVHSDIPFDQNEMVNIVELANIVAFMWSRHMRERERDNERDSERDDHRRVYDSDCNISMRYNLIFSDIASELITQSRKFPDQKFQVDISDIPDEHLFWDDEIGRFWTIVRNMAKKCDKGNCLIPAAKFATMRQMEIAPLSVSGDAQEFDQVSKRVTSELVALGHLLGYIYNVLIDPDFCQHVATSSTMENLKNERSAMLEFAKGKSQEYIRCQLELVELAWILRTIRDTKSLNVALTSILSNANRSLTTKWGGMAGVECEGCGGCDGCIVSQPAIVQTREKLAALDCKLYKPDTENARLQIIAEFCKMVRDDFIPSLHGVADAMA